MEHGGKRERAGRPKGAVSKNKIALDEIKKEIEEGKQLAPVAVMVWIMNKSLEEGRYDITLDAASKAAPYLHAKLVESKAEITQMKRPDQMTDEELNYVAGYSTTSVNTE
ncbi:hypothetical protein [Commensalibacter communis]|uniref:hypothetical protein n=1 Tax=Commensalibacter communis TaxID=2972786 RepID=UPI0022FF9FD3|nr:hypothetical protein [Commensalibacter communis]CAI3933635.1 unnamed protein product [Commensalibacter communis]CAI3944570.1 unnamed protein product [Commensalibacter communis]